MSGQHAVLFFGRYRRFHVTHRDGTDVRIDFDGNPLGVRSIGSADHYAQEVWRRNHAGWDADACQRWAEQASVVEERGWYSSFCDAAGWHETEEAITGPTGTPIEMIVASLNRYAAEGWKAIHVSEDHGIYLGVDCREESFPARIRYLLLRDELTARD